MDVKKMTQIAADAAQLRDRAEELVSDSEKALNDKKILMQSKINAADGDSKVIEAVTKNAAVTTVSEKAVAADVTQNAQAVKEKAEEALSFVEENRKELEDKIGKGSCDAFVSQMQSCMSKCDSCCSCCGKAASEPSPMDDDHEEPLPEKKENEEDNMTRAEAMAYDPDGNKHYLNVFLGIMSAEGVPYILLAARRWAIDRDDNKYQGNGWLEKGMTGLYKILDWDGVTYFMTNFRSRHFYGEAADVKPTTSYSDMLTKMAISDRVCNFMYKYGLCLQFEKNEAGAAKGEHFHIGTDYGDPQTQWWSVVNKIRQEHKLTYNYIPVTQSDYYEEEIQHPIQQI